MAWKRRLMGYAIAVVVLALVVGVWGPAIGPVSAVIAEPGVGCVPAVDREDGCNKAGLDADEQTLQPTPESPCPIHVPGGVICTGPEAPPGYGLRENAFFPVIRGSTP